MRLELDAGSTFLLQVVLDSCLIVRVPGAWGLVCDVLHGRWTLILAWRDNRSRRQDAPEIHGQRVWSLEAKVN
jgi:hypothetical protein